MPSLEIRLTETMIQDLRYALRVLRKNPRFASILVYGVLQRPLPYDEPDQIVQLRELNDRGRPMNVADPNFEDIRSPSVARTFAEGTGKADY
jgi:hypothetical protein